MMTQEETQTQETTVTVTIRANELGRMLLNVALFASKDKTRPVLTCVHVKIDADAQTLTAEATDIYSLAEESIGVQVVGSCNRSYLLQASDDLAPIIKSLRALKDSSDVQVSFGNSTVGTDSTPADAPVLFHFDSTSQTIRGIWLMVWPFLYARNGTLYHCVICGGRPARKSKSLFQVITGR